MQDNQPIEYTDYGLLSRALFVHLMYDECCGVLTYAGEFPSDIADGAFEFVFKCKKCKEKVILI